MAETVLPSPSKVLRVSELTRYLKYLVEQDDLLTAISVRGEISSFSKSPNGHIYFTLKDATSQVACVLFRREAMQQMTEIQELRQGVAAVVHGFLTVYEPRGSFQVYVERVLRAGDGPQFQRFEKLKAQLEQEGLFASDRKRALPEFPRMVALITSPDSQAYHDVLHRLRSQYPFVTVVAAGARVQGDGAADEMALAIDIVNRLTRADVILLVRGGGAPEELAAFNDERLARAIFASRIPIVTGIGHETDHSIADFVADRRAATPSLAAAVAVPDVGALVERAARLHAQMSHIMNQRVRGEKRRLSNGQRALIAASPQQRLRVQRQRADEMARASNRAIRTQLHARRSALQGLRAQLAALDPLAILARGYAVLLDDETGRVVSRKEDVRLGQTMRARVSDGQFTVRVEEP